MTGSASLDNQPAGVLHPDLLDSLGIWNTFALLHGHRDQLSNANGSLSSTLYDNMNKWHLIQSFQVTVIM